jgi:hypothetical protein
MRPTGLYSNCSHRRDAINLLCSRLMEWNRGRANKYSHTQLSCQGPLYSNQYNEEFFAVATNKWLLVRYVDMKLPSRVSGVMIIKIKASTTQSLHTDTYK